MQVANTSLSRQAEAGIKSHNPDLYHRKDAYERSQEAEGGLASGPAAQTPEIAPSPYMMLISRIDAMLRQGRVDPRVVGQLRGMLVQRIGGLTTSARRALVDTPEARALGVEDATRLPDLVSARLQGGEPQEGLLALLRNPSFAAAMKDETRMATYGPRGLLQAS